MTTDRWWPEYLRNAPPPWWADLFEEDESPFARISAIVGPLWAARLIDAKAYHDRIRRGHEGRPRVEFTIPTPGRKLPPDHWLLFVMPDVELQKLRERLGGSELIKAGALAKVAVACRRRESAVLRLGHGWTVARLAELYAVSDRMIRRDFEAIRADDQYGRAMRAAIAEALGTDEAGVLERMKNKGA